MTDLIKSVSIEGLLQRHQKALELIEEATALLKKADELAVSMPVPEFHLLRNGSGHRSMFDDRTPLAVQKDMAARAWEYLFNESGMRTFMDNQAREEWYNAISSNEVPDLTFENIQATFAQLHDSRGEIFERGVINSFRRLSWNHKTNKPQMFGKKIIIQGFIDARYEWMFVNHSPANTLDDMLRSLHILDKKPEPDHRDGTYCCVSDAIKEKQNSYENEYWHLRWYKAGTVHITFKRLDLIDQMNDILAKHYPDAVPNMNRAA